MSRSTQRMVAGCAALALFGISACGSSGNPDFTLTIDTPTVTLVQGGTTPVTLHVSALHGSQGSINVFLSGLPINVGSAPTVATVGIGSPQTFTLAAANNATLGPATLTVTGISQQVMTSSSVSHTTTLALTVNAPAPVTP